MIDKTKNDENVSSLKIAETVLVQGNLVDNQYKQNSDVLIPKKSLAYLLDVEPSNLVFSKTYDTEFDEILITFIAQNGRPLEMENNVNFGLLINKQK